MTNNKTKLLLSLITLSFLLVACGTTIKAPEPVSLTLYSTEGTKTIAQALSTTFSSPLTDLTIELKHTNTTHALEHLAAGSADFIVVTALLPGSEQFQQTPVARDGLAIIVHPDNPLQNLTLLELEQLYTGRIFNWRDVQGLNQTVQTVVRERGAGLNVIFQQTILKEQRITPNARVFPNNQAIVEFVQQTPNAIAYVNTAYINQNVKVLTIEEISPTPSTLTNGAYPLTYVLYLLTLPNPQANIRNFSQFTIQAAGQQIVTTHKLGRIN